MNRHLLEIFRTRIEDAPTPAFIPKFRSASDGLILNDAISHDVAYVISPLGDDDFGQGTLESPWETFEKARNEMAAGSIKTVYLRGGNYFRATPLTLSSDDSNQRWIAYPGETPIIDGNSRVDGTIFDCNSCDNLTFRGLKLQNLSGTSLSFAAIYANNCQNGIVVNCDFDDLNTGIRSTGGSHGWYVLGCPFTNIDGAGIESGFSSQDNNWTVAGCEASNVGRVKGSGALATFQNSGGHLVEYCTIYNSQQRGIAFLSATGQTGSVNNTARYNRIFNVAQNDNDMFGIGALGREVHDQSSSIHDNWIEDSGNAVAPGSLISGIYLDDGSSGFDVYNNLLITNQNFSCHLHGGQNNTFHNNICLLKEGTTPASENDEVALFYQTASTYNDPANMTGNTFEDSIILSVDGNKNPTPYDDTTAASNWIRRSAAVSVDPTMNGNTKWENIPNDSAETNPNNSNPGFADPSNDDFTLLSLPGNFTHILGLTDGGTLTWGAPGDNPNSGYTEGNYI